MDTVTQGLTVLLFINYFSAQAPGPLFLLREISVAVALAALPFLRSYTAIQIMTAYSQDFMVQLHYAKKAFRGATNLKFTRNDLVSVSISIFQRCYDALCGDTVVNM